MSDNDPVTIGALKASLESFYVEKLSFLENIVKENETLKNEVKNLNHRVNELELIIDDQAAYSRRNTLVVHGIPLQQDESEIGIAKLIGEIVDVSLKDEDIDAAHRLRPSSKNMNAPPFVLKLVSRFKKAELMLKAKKMKPTADVCGGDAKKKIFYADHLTKRNQEILYEARNLWDKYYVWTKNGLVQCREKNKANAPANRIYSVHEIEEYWMKATNTEVEDPDYRSNGRKRNVNEISPEHQQNLLKKPATPGKGIEGLQKFRYGKIQNQN